MSIFYFVDIPVFNDCHSEFVSSISFQNQHYWRNLVLYLLSIKTIFFTCFAIRFVQYVLQFCLYLFQLSHLDRRGIFLSFPLHTMVSIFLYKLLAIFIWLIIDQPLKEVDSYLIDNNLSILRFCASLFHFLAKCLVYILLILLNRIV